MSATKEVWVFVTYAGRAETLGAATFWEALGLIESRFASAATNIDLPKRLLRNGEPVELPQDLMSTAYSYRRDLTAAWDDATTEVRLRYLPTALRLAAEADAR